MAIFLYLLICLLSYCKIDEKCQSVMQRFGRIFNKIFLNHSIHPLFRDKKKSRGYTVIPRKKRDEISSRMVFKLLEPLSRRQFILVVLFFRDDIAHQNFPENLTCDIRTISFTLSRMFRLFSSFLCLVIIYGCVQLRDSSLF